MLYAAAEASPRSTHALFLVLKLRARARRVRRLLIERLTVAYAAAHELRPRGQPDRCTQFLGQQSPKRPMMPAQIMTARVSVCSNRRPQRLDLHDQLFAGKHIKILVPAHHLLQVCSPLTTFEPSRAWECEQKGFFGRIERALAGGARPAASGTDGVMRPAATRLQCRVTTVCSRMASAASRWRLRICVSG
jgi:hypothetical protein